MIRLWGMPLLLFGFFSYSVQSFKCYRHVVYWANAQTAIKKTNWILIISGRHEHVYTNDYTSYVIKATEVFGYSERCKRKTCHPHCRPVTFCIGSDKHFNAFVTLGCSCIPPMVNLFITFVIRENQYCQYRWSTVKWPKMSCTLNEAVKCKTVGNTKFSFRFVWYWSAL